MLGLVIQVYVLAENSIGEVIVQYTTERRVKYVLYFEVGLQEDKKHLSSAEQFVAWRILFVTT